MGRFINKRSQSLKPQKKFVASGLNKETKNKEVMMTTEEKIAAAQEILGGSSNVKKLKKDKGLIERADSAKTILTEDNKELLKD